MPKMKTHSGTKKRYKRTGSGKVIGHRTSQLHEQVRRRKGHPYKTLAKGQAAKVGKLLGTYDED